MRGARRGIILVTAASLLVPVVGVVTAPVLAHALGVVGRGQSGAAMATNLVIVGGVTIGLPQALTYVVARQRAKTRKALLIAIAFTTPLAVILFGGVVLSADFLVQGDEELRPLVLLGAILAYPTMLVGLLRGAAYGRQMWNAIALERALNSLLRLSLICVLAAAGLLTVEASVWIVAGSPVLAGFALIGVFRSAAPEPDVVQDDRSLIRQLIGFGSKEWVGSVSVMLMGRAGQLLLTPLAGVEQLGLFLVAVTVSDLPYLISQTVREVVFGASSRKADSEGLAQTSRLLFAMASAGALVVGVSLPWWITPVFGSGFDGAVIATWILLAASCVSIPGLMAGAGLDALGRPALRSVALLVALLTTICAIVLLSPPLGATGAAIAAFSGSLVSSTFMCASAKKELGLGMRRFWLLTLSDLHSLKLAITPFSRKFPKPSTSPKS